MVRFFTKRVVWAVVTILLVVTIAFFAVNWLLPYDFAVAVGQRPRAVEAIREQLHLNRPLVVQWLDYMSHLVRGDLGMSYDGDRVTSVVAEALPTTVAIFAVGGLIAYLLGEWVGRVVAWHRSRIVGGGATSFSVLAFTAFPPWLIFLLTYFLTERLFDVRGWFGLKPKPYGGVPPELPLGLVAFGLLAALAAGILLRNWARRHDRRALAALALPAVVPGLLLAFYSLGLWTDAIDTLLWPSLIMAAAGLVLIAFGETMLVMRAGVTSEMEEDYVFTARAKGVPDRVIRDRHVAPNAVLPALSRFLTSVPYLLSGLIIIERELRLHGLASVFFDAIENGNVPIIIGALVVVALIGLALRIVLDVIQAVMDPRVRLGGASR